MDERRLSYFLAVVDEGSVTRAARRLHVAQPSLSQAVRALESELGAELFHRVGRGLRLSVAGEALVGPARQVLRAIDEARDAITGIVDLSTGRLELAALATLAVDPMADLIGRFRDQHPGIEVRVDEPESAGGIRALAGVNVRPQSAVETAAREAIVPLVLAGAGAALLPAPLAREAERRGATVRSARPKITRAVGLVHRASRLSPTAAAFLALANTRRPDHGVA